MPPPPHKINMGRRGGGIGPPIIFITLIDNLDTSDLEWGRRGGGGGVRKKERKKYVSPPIDNGVCLMIRLCCLLFLLLVCPSFVRGVSGGKGGGGEVGCILAEEEEEGGGGVNTLSYFSSSYQGDRPSSYPNLLGGLMVVRGSAIGNDNDDGPVFGENRQGRRERKNSKI